MRVFVALVLVCSMTGTLTLGQTPVTPDTSQTAPASPPASPQAPPDGGPDLAKVTKQIQDEQERIKKELEARTKELNQLKEDIAKSVNITEKVNKTNERLDKLEEFNKSASSSALKLDRLRYEAGKKILLALIKDSGHLSFATDFATNMSAFQSSLNPSLNKNYSDTVTFVKGKTSGTAAGGILEKLGGAAGGASLLANPYVSLGFSVGSFLFSKFKQEDNKLEKVNDMACVMDFTTKVAPDLRLINFNMENLNAKVINYNTTLKARFQDYARAVNVDLTYEQYEDRVNATGGDPIDEALDKVFTDLSANADMQANLARGFVPPNLAALRFQVENVKTYLNGYEAIQTDFNDFMSGYIAVLKKDTEETVNPSLCNINTLAETREQLIKVRNGAINIQGRFAKEFNTKLLAPSKRVLYGIAN